MASKARKTPQDSEDAPNEAGAAKDIVRANVNRQITISPTFVSLYTNDTQFQVTPWDIRMTFGEISEVIAKPPTIVVKATGEVRMSPQHAKKIVQILTNQIAIYEEKIGPIPLPAD